MISLAPDQFVFVYLLIFLAGIFAVWLGSEWLKRRRERESRKHQIRCRLCGAEYENRASEPLPACPRCGRRNERKAPLHF